MTGQLLPPAKGAIKKNQHLKISRFTQHFEEKLDLSMMPMDFFKQKVMPEESIKRIRPLLGRYGCTGAQQSQVMNQLSAYHVMFYRHGLTVVSVLLQRSNTTYTYNLRQVNTLRFYSSHIRQSTV